MNDDTNVTTIDFAKRFKEPEGPPTWHITTVWSMDKVKEQWVDGYFAFNPVTNHIMIMPTAKPITNQSDVSNAILIIPADRMIQMDKQPAVTKH